ncbi:MAG: ribulokinase [Anaerolineales bacterium]|nr:ribulokinase [Anaerolineales bacterium]
MPKYVIGVDFGTESGRAVLVKVANGEELATAVYPYSHGVIDERLPILGKEIRLEQDWALQDPQDYIRVFQQTIPQVLALSGVDAADVIGVGIDFTACTMLPVKADGTPLCVLPHFRENPHAWVKLWKHHSAQPEADHINEAARQMGEPWLKRYGGKISSEWFFSKVLQILNDAPEIYQAADRLIEAADWVVWQLTGVETRNACTAGYKAIWSKREGFPSPEYFEKLHPSMKHVIQEKMSPDIRPMGEKAGGLSEQAAQWTHLKKGTAVAIANVDAHVAVPAATVTEPGRMVMIMGTSTCDMVLGDKERFVPGMCGYVEDGIIPGFFGYEAGQSCVGDHFAWFVEHCVSGAYELEAKARGVDIHKLLEEKVARLTPGESGLLALDWWNGNRSVLVDVDLTGLIIGATLATKPEEIYRALIEATAYGKRVIIETFIDNEVPIHELIACGGLPEKNKVLMQIYADVIGLPIRVNASKQTSALGSAMFGAVAAGKAAGGYESIYEAAKYMAHLKDETYIPDPENQKIYNQLYAEYLILHDYFGRGENDVMKRLKHIKAEQMKV